MSVRCLRQLESTAFSVQIVPHHGSASGCLHAPQLLWLKENHQAVLEGAAGWLAVCDWIAVCMGAVPCMGYSQASRTLALDLARRCWWLEGLSTAGLSAGLFPHLVAEGSRIGSVSEQAARLTGLQRGTPIYLAGHDHVCGALAGAS